MDKPDHVAFLPLDYFVGNPETMGRKSIERCEHAGKNSLPFCANLKVRDTERNMDKNLPAKTLPGPGLESMG